MFCEFLITARLAKVVSRGTKLVLSGQWSVVSGQWSVFAPKQSVLIFTTTVPTIYFRKKNDATEHYKLNTEHLLTFPCKLTTLKHHLAILHLFLMPAILSLDESCSISASPLSTWILFYYNQNPLEFLHLLIEAIY